MFEINKNGKVLNTPEKRNDHHMDGIRYALSSLHPIIRQIEHIRDVSYYEKEYINPAY